MYNIGQKFKINKITATIDTITDILKTYNSKNELVKIEYKSKFEFNSKKIYRVLNEEQLQSIEKANLFIN